MIIWPWQKANKETMEAVTRELTGEKTPEEELQESLSKLSTNIDSFQKILCFTAAAALITYLKEKK